MHHRRQRILSAAAELIAERGYRQVVVQDIVERAAIARALFYESFGSKEDCFVALYQQAGAAALSAVAEACANAGGDFPDRVSAGISALLAQIDSDRALASACIVEGPVAGDPISPHFDKLVADFGALLRSGRGGAGSGDLPDNVEETVIGGLYWFLYDALVEKRPKRLSSLRPQLVQFALIPFIGAEAAQLAAG